jgi:hypothetical protein
MFLKRATSSFTRKQLTGVRTIITLDFKDIQRDDSKLNLKIEEAYGEDGKKPQN